MAADLLPDGPRRTAPGATDLIGPHAAQAGPDQTLRRRAVRQRSASSHRYGGVRSRCGHAARRERRSR